MLYVHTFRSDLSSVGIPTGETSSRVGEKFIELSRGKNGEMEVKENLYTIKYEGEVETE